MEVAIKDGTFSSLEKMLVYELPSPAPGHSTVKADIDKARELVDRARRSGMRSPEAEEALAEASSAFEAGLLDEALGYAKTAQEALERFGELPGDVVLVPQEAAERLWKVREILNNLRRADVVFGDGEAILFRAEAALREGDFRAFETLMEEIEGVAASLNESLRGAALGLLQRVTDAVSEAKLEGVDTQSAEVALGSAERAASQERFADVLDFVELAKKIVAGDRNRHLARLAGDVVSAPEGDVVAADAVSSGEAREYADSVPSLELDSLASKVQEAQEEVRRAEAQVALGRARDELEDARDRAASESELSAEASVAEMTLEDAEEALRAGDFTAAVNLARTAIKLTGEAAESWGVNLAEEVSRQETVLAGASAMGVDVRETAEALSQARERWEASSITS